MDQTHYFPLSLSPLILSHVHEYSSCSSINQEQQQQFIKDQTEQSLIK